MCKNCPVVMACLGCRTLARLAADHTCGRTEDVTTPIWGWRDTDANDEWVTWVPGTIEESYARVSAFGGHWILVSADPIENYYAALASVAGAPAGDYALAA